jgi:hypothetical protein
MHLPDRQEGVAFKLRPETTTSAIFSRGARRSTAATTVGSSGDSMDSARTLEGEGRALVGRRQLRFSSYLPSARHAQKGPPHCWWTAF